MNDIRMLAKCRRMLFITIGVLYFLILVGGIVRATGSGLGCPDWPKCFGQWIPPNSAESLPAQFDISEFNLWKMWTEYINRLIGVLAGICIIITTLMAYKIRSIHRSFFYVMLMALFIVILQGVLGGYVVKTELRSWLVTIHYILALLLINILLYGWVLFFRRPMVSNNDKKKSGLIKVFLYVFMGLIIYEIILGTQLRESIDHISRYYEHLQRSEWIVYVGVIKYIHRSSSWLIIICYSVLFYFLYRRKHPASSYMYTVGILLLIQIISGLWLMYGALPPAFQAIHLWLAALIQGVVFMMILIDRVEHTNINHYLKSYQKQ